MRNLHKLLLPVILFSPPVLLASCETTRGDDSSVLKETVAQVEADMCLDLALERLTAEQYDALPAFAQDWVLRMDAAWAARCE